MPALSFPRYPGKWRHRALVDPRAFVGRYYLGVQAPRRMLLVWNRGLLDALVSHTRARPLGAGHSIFTLPRSSPSVGIAAPRGVGAPTTVTDCEELVAMGTREFVGVGYAGALAPSLKAGDVVVCNGAVRDEGTSHHYAAPEVAAAPSRELTRWLCRTLTKARISFQTGASWTTDAPYRETAVELRHYRNEGVLTVDMEASAMYIFGRARRVRTASVFVISDVLTDTKWEPHFRRFAGRLEEVGSAILHAWAKKA